MTGPDPVVEKVLDRLLAGWDTYLEPDRRGWRREMTAALEGAGLLPGAGLTDERIERAAEAIWDADLESAKARQPWGLRPPIVKEHYRSLARAALTSGGTGVQICGTVCAAGPNLEPLACAYKKGHEGNHSWATLPTFLASGGSGEEKCPTCEKTGPDNVDRDFDSGMLEAECGDEWHDRFIGGSGEAPGRLTREDLGALKRRLDGVYMFGDRTHVAHVQAWLRAALRAPSSTDES